MEHCESKIMETIDHAGRLFQDNKLVLERGRTKDPKLIEDSERMVDNTEHLKGWGLLDDESQAFDREKKRLINYSSIFPTTVRRWATQPGARFNECLVCSVMQTFTERMGTERSGG